MDQIFTANRLTDGLVVYLTEAGDWSEDVNQSFVCANEDDLASYEKRAVEAAVARRIVEPYAIDVQRTAEGVRPVRYREVIRAFGPSIDYAPGAA